MVASTSQPQSTGGSTPVPDPTILSTEALERAINGLKELLETKIDDAEKLTVERFKSVMAEFESVESARIEQKADTQAAVSAALTATKDAIAKTETGTAEQLRQLSNTFQAGLATQATLLGDLKERVARIESLKIGGQESRAGLYATIGIGITVVLAILSVIAFASGGAG